MIDGSPERGALSSVRVATSTRGYDISVYVQIGCTPEVLREAGDLAIDEYMRVFDALKRRIESKFKEAVA